MIEFSCGKCSRAIRAKDDLAGRRVKCPQCQAVLSVPESSAVKPEPMPKRSAAGVEEQEVAPSGAPIYRHKAEPPGFQPAFGDDTLIDCIGDHIDKHIGKVETVFHEIISDVVHIDVHLVEPSQTRPYYTLITSGMSERAMKVPPGLEDFRYAELLICLPADWPMNQELWNKYPDAYWPIGNLKFLARVVHQMDTWFCASHTIPNGGEQIEPFAPNTKLCCSYLISPQLLPEEACRIPHPDGGNINLFAVLPLYDEEMNFKLKRGADALDQRLGFNSITELLDIHRKNVCKKRFGLF